VTSPFRPRRHHRVRRVVLTVGSLAAILLPALIILAAITHQAGLGAATGAASIVLYPTGYAAARYHRATRRPTPPGDAAYPPRPQP